MANKNNYKGAFIMVASLFFMWAFAHGILDVLNKHFQNTLNISKAQSGLVQAMLYGAYFLMAIPAGNVCRKWGYKHGLVMGLLLYSLGALLFVPVSTLFDGSFPLFLICLFVIGCGLTCLETSANPYINVLGAPEKAAQRLNLAQSLNGFGWIMGPWVGGLLLLGDHPNISLPYVVLGGVTLVLAVVFSRTHLPEPTAMPQVQIQSTEKQKNIWHTPSFVLGVVTLFFYVAAQTGINSFFINYVVEADTTISDRTASQMLSIGGFGLLFVGRLIGTWMLRRIHPARMVLCFAVLATACMSLVMLEIGRYSVAALCATYLFESIMFPTIFSMALTQVPLVQTTSASSFLIMSIVGGAIAPVAMGYIGEQNMAIGFTVPLVCFLIVATYALWFGRNVKMRQP